VTLPALDEGYLVRPAKGPKYKVGPKCANPHCGGWAEHAHHIIRRSQIGAHDWIDIDGWVVGNLTGLCPWCHDDVTGRLGGHRAAIRIDLERREFWWCLTTSSPNGEVSYHGTKLLDPQPPTPQQAEQSRDQAEESEACPSCGHVRRRRSAPAGERRRRSSWMVRVPDDEAEHGAEVLDSLVESLAELCPSGDATPAGRYYVLVPALVHATLDVENFKRSMKGEG